jgi:hypothetical protein
MSRYQLIPWYIYIYILNLKKINLKISIDKYLMSKVKRITRAQKGIVFMCNKKGIVLICSKEGHGSHVL